MAEWLRRWTRNPMGFSRAGSNPARSEILFPIDIIVSHTHRLRYLSHTRPYQLHQRGRFGVKTNSDAAKDVIHYFSIKAVLYHLKAKRFGPPPDGIAETRDRTRDL